MALCQALAKRAFGATRVSLAPPSSVMTDHQTIVPPNAAQVNFHREYLTSTDTPPKGFFRRFLHRQSASKLPEFLTVPVGEKLREKLGGINISSDRLPLGGLSTPPPDRDPTADLPLGISVRNAKKILRLSQVEKLKAKLREIPETSISRSDFVRICNEGCESEEQGAEFAKMMDESINVIVLGNVVFLRPEQVAKSMESIISQSMPIPNDPRRKELHQMETQKMLIDQKARALARGELYCGLGFLLFQTIGAMRLTFWELSWDVMEPICSPFASSSPPSTSPRATPSFSGHRRSLPSQGSSTVASQPSNDGSWRLISLMSKSTTSSEKSFIRIWIIQRHFITKKEWLWDHRSRPRLFMLDLKIKQILTAKSNVCFNKQTSWLWFRKYGSGMFGLFTNCRAKNRRLAMRNSKSCTEVQLSSSLVYSKLPS